MTSTTIKTTASKYFHTSKLLAKKTAPLLAISIVGTVIGNQLDK